MLDERAFCEEFFELVTRDEIVMSAVNFSRSGRSRCVCVVRSEQVDRWRLAVMTSQIRRRLTRDAKTKLVWELGKETLDESALSYT